MEVGVNNASLLEAVRGALDKEVWRIRHFLDDSKPTYQEAIAKLTYLQGYLEGIEASIRIETGMPQQSENKNKD